MRAFVVLAVLVLGSRVSAQEEAKIEKTQAELEQVSKAQLSHMAGGKAAKAAAKQKTKIEKA